MAPGDEDGDGGEYQFAATEFHGMGERAMRQGMRVLRGSGWEVDSRRWN